MPYCLSYQLCRPWRPVPESQKIENRYGKPCDISCSRGLACRWTRLFGWPAQEDLDLLGAAYLEKASLLTTIGDSVGLPMRVSDSQGNMRAAWIMLCATKPAASAFYTEPSTQSSVNRKSGD